MCKPTNYVKNHFAYDAYTKQGTPFCKWWLRTPGYNRNYVAIIENDGLIDYDGNEEIDNYIGVRPAMWIKLD